MVRFALKLALTALVFIYILPLIPGITFSGGFTTGILLAFIFGIMLWLVDLLAMTISAVLTLSSLGLALLWLIPLWLLGFWLLPAVALKLVAHFFSTHLTITGWLPAIWGGLVMLFIGVVTSSFGKLLNRGN